MASKSRKATAGEAVSRVLRKVLLAIPSSGEVHALDPLSRSRRLRTVAARKAAAISTGMSLPPGPIGMLTVLPDLMAIWKVQSALVADIASVYGKTASLTRESMLYCLFKHGGAALVRDVVVRVGERFVVRRASIRSLQTILAKIGLRVAQPVIGRTVTRWLPIAGALGCGAYTYYDTKKVGDNAIGLFSAEVVVESGDETPHPAS